MDAYDLSNEQLVKNFMNACARTGLSGSGIVIDPCAGSDREYAHYLKGVVLSRLDGKIPPFKSGTTVRVKPGIQARSEHYYSSSFIKPNGIYTISKVLYGDNGNWLLHFKELESERSYHADCFEEIKAPTSQT